MTKKLMILTWGLLALLAGAWGVCAANAADSSAPPPSSPGSATAMTPTAPVQTAEAPPYYPFGMNAEIGILTGYGGELNWRFSDHLGVRGGFDYFNYTRNGNIKDSSYNANIRLKSEPVALDIFPSANSSLRVSLGVVFNQNHVSGTDSSGTFTLNGTTYNGNLNLNISQQPVDPYVSVGGVFFYFDHAHHWSFGGEIGAMYTGSARVSLTTTSVDPGAAAAVADEQSKVQNFADKLHFWPSAKLQIGFAF